MCGPSLNSPSPTVQWFEPSAEGFPQNAVVNVVYSDAATNSVLSITDLPNGQKEATFTSGTTTVVQAMATDNLGNTANCQFTVSVSTPSRMYFKDISLISPSESALYYHFRVASPLYT